MIDLWVNYPIQNPHFDAIWDWFALRVENEDFVISAVVFKEIEDMILYGKVTDRIPEASKFISILNNFKVYEQTKQELMIALEIKQLLEIEEYNYGKGVGYNDLCIIANAKAINTILINNEAVQNTKPVEKKSYKIPAVCGMPEVGVTSLNLVELLNNNHLW
jgi:predicted nucleic acid-binding protein